MVFGMGSLAIGIFAFIFVVWIMPVLVKKFAPSAPSLGGSISGLGTGLSDFFKGLFEPVTLGISALKDISSLEFRPTFKPTIGYSLEISKDVEKDVEIDCPEGFQAKKGVLGWSCVKIQDDSRCAIGQKWCEETQSCIGILAKCQAPTRTPTFTPTPAPAPAPKSTVTGTTFSSISAGLAAGAPLSSLKAVPIDGGRGGYNYYAL